LTIQLTFTYIEGLSSDSAEVTQLKLDVLKFVSNLKMFLED